MIANPARSVLKRKNGYICISCLFKPAYPVNWPQMPRFLTVYPTPDPSVAAALYEDLENNHRKVLARSAKSKAIDKSTGRVKGSANTEEEESFISGEKSTKQSKTRENDVPREDKKEESESQQSGAGGELKFSVNSARNEISEVPTEVDPLEAQVNDVQRGRKNPQKLEEAEQRKLKPRNTYIEKPNTKIEDDPYLKESTVTNLVNLSKSDVEYEEKEVNLAASSDRAVPSSKQLGRGRPSRREKRMRNTLPRPSKKLRLKEGSPFQGRTFRKDTSSGAEPLKDLSQDAEPTNSFQILSRDKASLLHKLNRTISGHKESLIAKDKAISGKSSSVRFVSSGDSNKFIGSVPFSQAIGHQPLKLALGRQKQAKAKQSLEKTIKGAIELIQAKKLSILPIEVKQPPVPGLSYGLERVLFNQGVYFMQDPRSRVYNFDPYLQKIMPVSEFDFNALKEYITSSKDQFLTKLAETHGKRYVGSSSSMTGALAHFHFLLSQWREINTSSLSKGFPDTLRSFTNLQRCPSAIFLNWKGGTYAIDADKEFDSANVLSMLGKSMEKLLTLDTDEYEKYRKTNPGQISDEERNTPEAYHYSTMGDFLMRSQLDAFDARLPGTGMFDLKTRAVVTIRMDAKNYEQGSGYEITSRYGEWESFEREYFDMIRAAFLKYSLQVRMGRMDGIFVAFHNTERIFGFQYVSLLEMDTTLHGQPDVVGDQEFKLSLELLNKILDKATEKFPQKSIRIHFETREAQTPFMYVFAEPVTDAQVQSLQSRNKAKIEEFERKILGLNKAVSNSDDVEKEDNNWADIQANVQEAMDKDERSVTKEASTAVEKGEETEEGGQEEEVSSYTLEGVSTGQKDTHSEDDPKQDVEMSHEDSSGQEDSTEASPGSGKELQEQQEDEEPLADEPTITFDGRPKKAEWTDENTSESTGPTTLGPAHKSRVPSVIAQSQETHADSQFLDLIDREKESTKPPEASDILAMTLTIRNKINNKYVLRPENLGPTDNWSVEYSLEEVPQPDRAWSLYQACQLRRKKRLDDEQDGEQNAAVNYYVERMRELSNKGKAWRKQQDQQDEGSQKIVVGQPLSPEYLQTHTSTTKTSL